MPDTSTARAWSTDKLARQPLACDDTIEITDDMLMDLDRDLGELAVAASGSRPPPPWNRLPRP
jgi:hypothetical protein